MSRTQSSASEAADGCPRLVLLVGAPGAGKTTIGRALAQRLRVNLVETDDVVAEWAGKPVAEVVLDDGEETFRALEAKAVEQVLTGSGVGSSAVERWPMSSCGNGCASKHGPIHPRSRWCGST